MLREAFLESPRIIVRPKKPGVAEINDDQRVGLGPHDEVFRMQVTMNNVVVLIQVKEPLC